jgi:ubiquinone/menaquinone biosynthesis C-methylase UbiE
MAQVINAEETKKTYFGEKAALYDQNNEHTSKRENERRALREFLSAGVKSVLDIPVGTGTFFPIYRELGLKVTGMDVSPEMMAQATAKDPDIEVVYGDILDIPMPEKFVDAVVCIRLLALIDQDSMVKAMMEMGRVARERIIVSLYTGPQRERHSRHFVHLASEFEDAAIIGGFVETASVDVNGRGYCVKLLTKCP